MGWTSQYVLENEQGERYDLTAPAPVYLVNVTGLGISNKRNYASIGGGFFSLVSDEQPQNPINGDLIYLEGAYNNYQTLVNWIARAKTLYFCYTPLDTEYRCSVRLNYINKARRDEGGKMRAGISFHPLTPLYEPETSEVVEPISEYAKAYLEHDGSYYYTYDDDLVYGPEISEDMHKQIVPAGHEPSAFLLRYTGAIKNPVISVVGASGKVHGECHIADTLVAGETLELCTAPNNCYVHKISGGVVTDLMMASLVDLAYDPYPRAPVDESSVLSIVGDEPIAGTTELTVYRYYRSV
jgi:hypothetical protein